MNAPIDTDAMLAAGVALANVRYADPGALPYVVVPQHYKVESLESHLPYPKRAKGAIALHDAASFIELVDQLRSDRTRIYFDEPKATFTAVFNDTVAGEPGWRDHRALYACPISPEWAAWTGIDGKQMTQELFATFVEDHIGEIASPPAAEALEISRSIQAKSTVNFASSIRLQTGATEFTYEETIAGSAAKGKLAVPERFLLGLPVLKGGAKYALDARLRYRINQGRLLLWFDLVRPDKIREDALADVIHTIADKTRLPILAGAA